MSDSSTDSPSLPPAPRVAKILVCDDDDDARAIVRHALEAIDYRVIEAADAYAAQAAVAEHTPQLIVMDIMMPGMSGLEFVKWFRENHAAPFTPIIFLTALGEVENRVEGLALGGDDYLVKPFHYRELQARVQALLRIQELTTALSDRSEELHAANEELIRTRDALVSKERELAAVQFAGAAAHHVGQPATAILLQCRVLESAVKELEKNLPADINQDLSKLFTRVEHTLQQVKAEAHTIGDVLSKLQRIDANQTQPYLGDMNILDIDKVRSEK